MILIALFIIGILLPACGYYAVVHLKGLRRILAIVLVLIVPFLPPVLFAFSKSLKDANAASPDAGAYMMLGFMMVAGIWFLLALVGIACGSIVLYIKDRNSRKRLEDVF